MAENLKYEKGGKCGDDERNNDGYYLLLDNNTANCDKYGRLYNWATTMGFPSTCNSGSCKDYILEKHQGICPDGWHIPSDAEWNVLIKYIHADNGLANHGSGTSNYAGKYLKTASGWDDYIKKDTYSGEEEIVSGNGTDNYGFAALPGGCGDPAAHGRPDRFIDSYAGKSSYWWSPSEGGVSNNAGAYYRSMNHNSEYIEYANYYSSLTHKSYLYSVRCLQD
jgi:uncharacterized protein (TIGR02145 family)